MSHSSIGETKRSNKEGFGAWYEKVQQEEKKDRDLESGFGFGLSNSNQFSNLYNGFVNDVSSVFGGGELSPGTSTANSSGSTSTTGSNSLSSSSLNLSNINPLLYAARLRRFTGFLVLAIFFYLLGIFVGLPVIVLRPAKFALCTTIGSICSIAAIASIVGKEVFWKNIVCNSSKWHLLSVYFLTLFFTLYGAIWSKSYIVVLISLVLQISSFLALLLQSLPGTGVSMQTIGTIFAKLMMTMVNLVKQTISFLIKCLS